MSEMDWIDINEEKPPLDGTPFLGWSKAVGQVVCHIPASMAHYKKLEALLTLRGARGLRPSHWKRLSPGPNRKG